MIRICSDNDRLIAVNSIKNKIENKSSNDKKKCFNIKQIKSDLIAIIKNESKYYTTNYQ